MSLGAVWRAESQVAKRVTSKGWRGDTESRHEEMASEQLELEGMQRPERRNIPQPRDVNNIYCYQNAWHHYLNQPSTKIYEPGASNEAHRTCFGVHRFHGLGLRSPITKCVKTLRASFS